jgi:hypothetical protein
VLAERMPYQMLWCDSFGLNWFQKPEEGRQKGISDN